MVSSSNCFNLTPKERDMNYEMFLDECYYEMWCVRNKNDKRFNSITSFHFDKKEDAETFLELIKKAK